MLGTELDNLADVFNGSRQYHRQRCAVVAIALVGVKSLCRVARAHLVFTDEAAQLTEKIGEIRLIHDCCWMIRFVRILFVRILLARGLGV